MPLHPLQASTQHAEEAFAFLAAYGYVAIERFITGGVSFKDGWQLTYASDNEEVVIAYLDQELEIWLRRAGRQVSYFAVDRELFGRRSGFHGQMFPPGKVAGALDRIAADMNEHYGGLLQGRSNEWEAVASAAFDI